MTLAGVVARLRDKSDHYLPDWARGAMGEAADLLESQAKALSEARAKLFPYADATEISGMSWSGFYLIGDKKSIRELKRLEHRSAQLEVFSKEYDLRTEALKAHVQAAEARLAEAMEIIAIYSHDGQLQTFESREAFRSAARAFMEKI